MYAQTSMTNFLHRGSSRSDAKCAPTRSRQKARDALVISDMISGSCWLLHVYLITLGLTHFMT